MKHADKSNILSNLETASESDLRIHYINGYLKKHSESGFVRIYPDLLAPRFFVLVREQDISFLREWSDDEMAAFRISSDGKYFSVGIEHGVPVQLVKVTNVTMGSIATKSLIGVTPESLRASATHLAAGAKSKSSLFGGRDPIANGGGGSEVGDGHEPADRSAPVTSAY